MKSRRIPVDYSHRWPFSLKAGDVIARKNGPFRVVREVHHFTKHSCKGSGTVSGVWIFLAIKRCSWTHRPYTLYRDHELLSLGYVPIGVRVTLDSDLDKFLAYSIRHSEHQLIDCCDIKGIA